MIPALKAQWIKAGQQWPKDPPNELTAYMAGILSSPPNEHLLPTASPYKLSSQELPIPDDALITPKASSCFSDSPPNKYSLSWAGYRLPAKRLVQHLIDSVNQSILDGAQSIENPAYKGERLPLWVITAWSTWYSELPTIALWQASLQWLTRAHLTETDREKVEQSIQAIGWNEPMSRAGHGGQQSGDMSSKWTRLLSDSQVTDTIVDYLFEEIAERLEEVPEVDADVCVVATEFMWKVEKEYDEAKGKMPSEKTFQRHAQKLRSRIQDKKFLVMPLFFRSLRHFVAVRVNLEERTIEYGDSLSHECIPRPTKLLEKLQWWLKHALYTEFEINMGDTIEHGKQEDMTSCGVLTWNTISHSLLGDDLWHTREKEAHRVRAFNALVTVHLRYRPQRPLKQMSIRNLLNPSKSSEPAVEPHTVTAVFALPRLPSVSPPSPALETEPMHATLPRIDKDRSTFLYVAKTGTEDEELMVVDTPVVESMSMTSKRPSTEDARGERGSKRRASSAADTEVVVKRQEGGPSEFNVIIEDHDHATSSSSESDVDPTQPVLTDTDSEIDVELYAVRKPGTSKSALFGKRLKELQASGAQFPNQSQRVNEMMHKIHLIDKEARFIDVSHIRCMNCGKTQTLQQAFKIEVFKAHRQRCKGEGGMRPITDFFKVRNAPPPPPPPESHPCPGLTELDSPKIALYIKRTGALGGGGSSVSSISEDLYGKHFIDLSESRQREVKLRQHHQWLWKNEHTDIRVFSIECTRKVLRSPSDTRVLPCYNCTQLLSRKKFKNAISKPIPLDENLKHVNHEYRNHTLTMYYAKALGLREIMENENPKLTALVLYTRDILDGKHAGNKGDEFFANLIIAYIEKRKRADRGKGMQGYQYTPDLYEFSHIIEMSSSGTFSFVGEFLPLPVARHLKQIRSKILSMPLLICDETFEFARHYLRLLNYKGPVALSCDDTKLASAFRPYFDKQQQGYVLLGATSDPVLLADPGMLRQIIKENSLQKATKLRLFCLQVPLPKVPVIVLAAKGISDKLKADDLFRMLSVILQGLQQYGIRVRSYASDGSAVECSVQDKLNAAATRVDLVNVVHPGRSNSNVTIKIHFHNDNPIVNIQDPNHGLKSTRNNAFSGARLLTFPNDVVMYSQFRQIAYDKGPIYTKDIEKLDRQDDNAATRLFAADTLQWLVEHHALDRKGVIVYLFVFGELIDAYRSRTISIHERVKMVLRAHFFLEFWTAFLAVGQYTLAKHLISREFIRITRTLIDGFLQLVIVYRDHCPPFTPFLPWLVTTEACEHMFGSARHLVKDFTMADFHQMLPKLAVKMRQAVFSSQYTDGKARASGYSHTYTDCRGVDLQSLAQYPSNEEMNLASKVAYSEATNLFALLGVNGDHLLKSTASTISLPSIDQWYHDSSAEFEGSSDNDDTSSMHSDSELEDDVTLQSLLDSTENLLPTSNSEEHRLNGLRRAAAALIIEDTSRLAQECNMDEIEEEAELEALSDAALAIAELLAQSLPAPDIQQPPDPVGVLVDEEDIGLDLEELPAIRRRNQTKQAETSTRVHVAGPSDHPSHKSTSIPAKSLSEKQRVLKALRDVIKEEDPLQRLGTGMERRARHTDSANNSKGAGVTGNAANAAAVSKAQATKALTRRRKIMAKYKLPEDLGSGTVTEMAPLVPLPFGNMKRTAASYGFVMLNSRIYVASVLAIYGKSNGKYGNNSWRDTATNVTVLSGIAIQTYGYLGVGDTFQPFHDPALRPLNAKRFAHISPNLFLRMLQKTPKTLAASGELKLAKEDVTTYRSLNKLQDLLVLAIQELNARKSKDEDDTDDD